MKDFKEISPKELDVNPFTKIGKEWMLITAGTEEKFNTMTASWGGMGVLWNKDAAFTFIRPSRYTFEFTEAEGMCSLCFFPEEYRQALTFCGRNSGRDCDKVKQTGLTPMFVDGVPCFEEAETVLLCRKLYSQPMGEEFVCESSVKSNYAEGEKYHTMYVCEIVKVLVKE
ncbi:MAG: flavin reductase [Ruminococcus sp.]